MPLKAPNLDDRSFQQLLDQAKLIIRTECPEWTDLTPGDPGIVILELFAFLTETMIYRLNRLPEKAYVEFLRLMGVKLNPPSAASVKLKFSLSKPQNKPVDIPRGTRVTVARGGGEQPPMFVVLETVSIPAGQTDIETVAYHCELISAEDAGKGSGLPGASVTAKRPPIVAATADQLELLVGVEADASELTGRTRALKFGDKAFAVWREVENFSNLGGTETVYVVDRVTGTVTFGSSVRGREPDGTLRDTPTTLAAVPKAGREIRLWYCSGGGSAGNVAANTLTTLKDAIAGVSVTNPEPAIGGREAETLENALIRGPQELHSLQRAVTARDFELLALRSSGTAAASGSVARAKAYTKARLWEHADPGTVEVLLVPFVPEEQRLLGVVKEQDLIARQTSEALQNISRALAERRPLATTCLVNWVRYKEVRVEARAVIHRGEDPDAVKARVLSRLHQTINPLASSRLPSPGWSFGHPLRASNVYDIMLAEPGVSYIDKVQLFVDEVPETDISSLAADAFQTDTWYATTHGKLFRSMDNADGWELIDHFPDGEETVHVRVNTFQAGQLAVVTSLASGGSRLYVSDDCGETWRALALTAFAINDMAWSSRQGLPLLIMATDNGLFELSLKPDSSPVQIGVDASRPTLGFTAVAASIGIRGTFFVAAAARSKSGVFLSSQGGQSNTFTLIGGTDDDIRVLEIQQDGVRTFLWAGSFVAGTEASKGVLRWELQGAAPPGEGTRLLKGWEGGSCRGLTFTNAFAFAATFEAGVLWLDLTKGDQAGWHKPVTTCGLPIRGQNDLRFHPIMALAGDVEKNIVLAGGPFGIFRSVDNGTSYQASSSKVFQDRVTLPETWLFVSGEHKIEVVNEDEAR